MHICFVSNLQCHLLSLNSLQKIPIKRTEKLAWMENIFVDVSIKISGKAVFLLFGQRRTTQHSEPVFCRWANSVSCQLGRTQPAGLVKGGKLFFAANIEICLSVLTIHVTCNSFGSCPSDENGLQTHHRNPRLDGRLRTGPHLLHHHL